MKEEQIREYEYYKNKKERLETELDKYKKLDKMRKINKEGGLFYELVCRINIKLYDCGSDGNHWTLKDEINEDIPINEICGYFDNKKEEIQAQIEACNKIISEI